MNVLILPCLWIQEFNSTADVWFNNCVSVRESLVYMHIAFLNPLFKSWAKKLYVVILLLQSFRFTKIVHLQVS